MLEDRFRFRRSPLAAQDQPEPEVRFQSTGVDPDGLAVRRLSLVVSALPRVGLGAIAQGLGIGHRSLG